MNEISKARDFIYANARLIDRRLYAALFEDGDKQLVINALRPYQNDDGGFGNALEPDKRVPDSQPQDVEVALRIMDLADAFDHELVRQACDFLETVTTDAGGVPFSLPSVNTYPHAPWWASDANPPAALNPTAAIAGLLHKHQVVHPWLERASEFCWQTIETSNTTEFHDLLPMFLFLEHAPDRARATRLQHTLGERVKHSDMITTDEHAEGYVKHPLDLAETPQSYARRLFSDHVLRENVRQLAAAQQADGGWPISWPPISPGVEVEYRGHVTVRALAQLRAYREAGLGEIPGEQVR